MPKVPVWVKRVWEWLATLQDALGVWTLLAGAFAWLGGTALISALAIAFVEAIRSNLNWFGQACFVIGVALLLLAPITYLAPRFIKVPKQTIPALQKPQTKVYSEEETTKFVAQIDEYIDKLTHSRESLWVGNHDPGQESQSVNRYFEWIQEWAWEAIPEYAQVLIPDRVKMTEGEIMMYVGWPNNTAALRVIVDRQLLKLRQVKALLLGHGTASSRP
ncbi:MAG: hypothetical protein Q7T26_06310 [Dehalococcoidia bacterium]|nr:hypothetical protein [Dehalococcoidia bacterium]